jgi:hypothetical protein
MINAIDTIMSLQNTSALSNEELAQLSPNVPSENKRVEVRLDEQLLLAYEYGKIVFATRVSTGGKRLSGTYTTPIGDFITYHKRPTRHMATGDIASNGFDLPGVPWVLYITEGGISFHGTYWHNDYGFPHSHGCTTCRSSGQMVIVGLCQPCPDKYLMYGNVRIWAEIKDELCSGYRHGIATRHLTCMMAPSALTRTPVTCPHNARTASAAVQVSCGVRVRCQGVQVSRRRLELSSWNIFVQNAV